MKRFSKKIDHLGLVAGMCNEIDLTQMVDRIIPADPRAELSVGECLKLMIINAMGFAGRALYLEAEFFSNRSIQRLLGRNVSAEKITDDRLGRALDRLYEAGCDRLFNTIACAVFKQFHIDSTFRHLDTTSISVHGEYEDGMGLVEFGYSKDHQPGLKQFMISLMSSQDGDVPLLAKTLAGNTADKTHFLDTLKKVREGIKGMEEPACYVCDSAGYTKEIIQTTSKSIKWISRVPQTLREVKQIAKQIPKEAMKPCIEGYAVSELGSIYGGVKQRWLVVFSKKRHAQAMATLHSHITKEFTQAKKDLKKLQATGYSCAADAERALRLWEKKLKYHKCTPLHIHCQIKRTSRGRPKAGDPVLTMHYLNCELERDTAKIAVAQEGKGFFIIATNELDSEVLPIEKLLSVYKDGQQSVERGFRLLKDPRFMTSSVFLKKEERIVALGLVMCLSLLIYTLTQRKLRLELQKQGKTIPSQTGKPTKKPTMRWVYECFEGITIFYEKIDETHHEFVLNMRQLHMDILRLLGITYQKIYEDAA